MTAVTGVWLRLEWRRRWRALAVLTLLVAVSTGTVLTALAAARRTDSVVDRLTARSTPADVTVNPNTSGFDWSVVRALPQVKGLAILSIVGFGIEGIDDLPTGNACGFCSFDDAALYQVERPVVLAGRLPDPTRLDEAVVTPRFAERYGRGLGSVLTARLNRPEILDQAFTLTYIPKPDGQTVRLKVVGVVRSNFLSDAVADTGWVVASPAVFRTYRTSFVGHEVFPTQALVSLRGGAAAIPAFQAALAAATGRSDIDVTRLADLGRQPRQAARFEAACLLAFALAALVAALVVVGQSVARQVWVAVPAVQVLRALGLAPRSGVVAAAAGPVLAGLAGTGLGVAGAVLGSRWFPFGTAALVEPTPGIQADVVVLLAGAALAVLAIAIGAGMVAHLALRVRRAPSGGRPMVAANRSPLIVALRGFPVPILTGARFAVERGRGAGALPVRPALLGAVTGVLGVLAAFTILAAGQDAAASPARFGQTHQLQFTAGYNGQDFLPSRKVLTAIATDPDVLGTNDSVIASLESGNVKLYGFGYDPVGRPVPTVMLAGRMPSGPREVVVGPATARALGVQVGAPLRLAGAGRGDSFTVTGIGFVPADWFASYDSGVWLTRAGLAAATDNYQFHNPIVALRPGVSPEAVMPRLSALAGQAAGTDPVLMNLPTPVPQFSQLRQVLVMPLLLGLFLVVLGIGAVSHALATAERRRRLELAVLRALGMTRPQTRLVFATQAVVLAVVGLAFGVPLGITAGRGAWRAVADYLPLQYLTPATGSAILLLAPATLVLANLLAAWPARRAARLRVADVLRAE